MNDLSRYVADARASGQTDERIRQGLADAGWQREDIDRGFGQTPAKTFPAKRARFKVSILVLAIGIVAILIAIVIFMRLKARDDAARYASFRPEELMRLQPHVDPECVQSGCNGELCLDKSAPAISTNCDYSSLDSCFRLGRCEVQSHGRCGWTRTEEMRRCWEWFSE